MTTGRVPIFLYCLSARPGLLSTSRRYRRHSGKKYTPFSDIDVFITAMSEICSEDYDRLLMDSEERPTRESSRRRESPHR